MTKAAAKPGHNSGLDPAQERVFVREFTAIKEAETEMAESKGVLSGIYKRLEKGGFTKEDIAWAKELEKKNVGEVIATMRRRISIAKIMGHQVGRQIDLFDKDRTPIEDAAFDEGLAAGKLRRANANPYGMETASGQNWQKGFNEGTAFVNEALAEAINDNIIKVPDAAGDDDEADADDADNSDAPADDWDASAPAADAAE